MSQEPKKVGRRTFLNYVIAVVATGVIVGAATYLATPKGAVTVTAPGTTVTAPGTTVTTTKTVTTTVTGTTTVPTTTTPVTTVTPDSWWADAAKKYAGTTIHVLAESVPPPTIVGDHVPEFEKLTGIKVEYELTYYDDVYAKEMADFAAHTAIYDVLYVEIEWLGAYAGAGYLFPVEDMMKEHPELTDPNLDLDDFVALERRKFKNKLYTLPFETFGYLYYYRKDLFEKYASDFKKEYGRDLTVPKTMEEYEDIAKFFTGREPNLYGHLAQAKAHNALECDWENFHHMFGSPQYENDLLDWSTMRASGVVNSYRGVEALEYYIKLLKYAPPGALSYTWDEAGAAMQEGIIAQGPFWGDWAMSMFDPKVSKVVGKIGFASFPRLSWNPNAKNSNGCASGWGINADSKHKEAAWLFIQWTRRKGFDAVWMKDAGVLGRKSSLKDPLVQEADKKFNNLFTAMFDASEHFYFPLIIPEYSEMKTAAEEPLGLAVSGKISAKEALDMLAARWDEILKRSYP